MYKILITGSIHQIGLEILHKEKDIEIQYAPDLAFDEIFKIYCANKIIKKTKLFIFQHGDGGYFADDDFYNIGWDKKLCNKYFVWGKNPKKGCKAFFYTKKYIFSWEWDPNSGKKSFVELRGGSQLRKFFFVELRVGARKKNRRVGVEFKYNEM